MVRQGFVDGNSLAATSRLTCVDKDVVMRLGVMVGFGCMKLHDRLVREVHARYIEVDECWALVGRHERRKRRTDPRWFGDQYTFFAIDSESNLVPSYLTAKRSLPSATHFMVDLRQRVPGVPQVSVDGWPHWTEALRRAFGHRGVHAGAIVKSTRRQGWARVRDTSHHRG
jgi:transposase-like protein